MSDAEKAAIITGLATIIGALLTGYIQGCAKSTSPPPPPPPSASISASPILSGKAFEGDWIEQFYKGAKGREFHWVILTDSGTVTGHTIGTGGVEHNLTGKLTSETTFEGQIKRTRPGVPGDVAEANVKAQTLPTGFEWQVTWTKSSQNDEVKVGDSEKSEFWRKN